ncbi:hypothetical protein CC80DRAFT_578822 [Byssothecium circinans]|uniref:Uncharacterized protein n=1 Tax=Byssothecium circinans TaxID=147558 RepID=A0A6A5TEQ0_9PLEO|nr:hypothetical protein CC80DRAFT_578822 [Byssothecium circinans]
MAFILRPIVKGVSTGIGLAGEKYHDRQQRKSALAEQEGSLSSSDQSVEELINPLEPGAETADDERIWALDEASSAPPRYEDSVLGQQQQRPIPERTISDLVNDVVVLRDREPLPASKMATRLPHPIIIPQRRPGSKGRGFARAYPPDLEAFGLGQDTFMEFLQMKKHRNGAAEAQSRFRENAFLEKINKDVFMPVGLYCMVIMCNDTPSSAETPEFSINTVNLDAAKNITKWGVPKQTKTDDPETYTSSKVLRPVRHAYGRTEVSQIPLEIAPLVYPGLDDMDRSPQVKRDESFKQRIKRNKDFFADYLDRRARAEYAGNNPDSTLTKASPSVPEFHTRFGDPNHPVNNGHIMSLISGGKRVPQPDGRLRAVGEDGKLMPQGKRPDTKRKGPVRLGSKGVGKVVSPGVLYLAIVHLLSKEELAEAREALGLDTKEGEGNVAGNGRGAEGTGAFF